MCCGDAGDTGRMPQQQQQPRRRMSSEGNCFHSNREPDIAPWQQGCSPLSRGGERCRRGYGPGASRGSTVTLPC